MRRPLSQLFYTRIQDTGGSPTVITLHPRGGRGGDLADMARQVAPEGRLLGLESYKGVFIGREIVGYAWFIGPDDRPSPVFFGDGMAEIERFLWDEVDRQHRDDAALPFLLGVEQGGIMALAMAAATPDLLSGVIALDASLPLVPGWDPPLAPLDGLPILLSSSSDPVPGGTPTVLTGERLVETLTRWGGTVTQMTDDGPSAAAAAQWLVAQPVRTLRRSTGDDVTPEIASAST
ncbi:MAG TPA: hypothetical protein VGT61_08695 [Thermomicrobiales bacterium]|jgi:predicted esterase|nr:hypothetical protein [Thermomicrobiales bacterium]